MEKSDLVISFGSTIGIEATFYNKPSILWGVAYYEDTGGVYEINSLKELEKLLRIKLKPKPYENSLKFASKKSRKNYKYQGFGPPKTLSKSFQNASEIDVPPHMRFLNDCCWKKPLLQERQHRFRIGKYNTKSTFS